MLNAKDVKDLIQSKTAKILYVAFLYIMKHP